MRWGLFVRSLAQAIQMWQEAETADNDRWKQMANKKADEARRHLEAHLEEVFDKRYEKKFPTGFGPR